MRSILLISIFSTQFAFAQHFFDQGNGVVVTKNSTSLNLAWSGGLNAPQFSTTDINHDGKKDLMVFDRDDHRFMPLVYNMYFGTEENIYEYKPEFIKEIPQCNNWAFFKDINNDGKEDLFTSSFGGIKYYKNNSTSSLNNFTLIDTLRSKRSGVEIKMFVSKVDIPGFADIDSDGDIDILNFDVFGNTIELNENISTDLNDLKFKVTDKCWGDFSENSLDNSVVLSDPSCTGPSFPQKKADPQHVGSTMALYDLDNDSDYEIMLGDVSFKNIVQLNNSLVGGEYVMDNQNTNFPSGTTPIDVDVFPAVYFVDLDHDNKMDMIASPNTSNNTENQTSVWYYKNSGTTEMPQFNFVKKNALQDQMIDVGRFSKVRLFDYNNDGLMDLTVAAGQVYDPAGTKSQISLYENIGTATAPKFDFISEDFANLSNLNLGTQICPSFADLDNDGKEDMVVGLGDGTLVFFKNNTTSTSPMNFTANHTVLNSIDVGNNATPTLFDINNDGKIDLLVGTRQGKIHYYKNISTSNTPEFEYITNHFGQITIVNNSNIGFLDLQVISESGEPVIYVGSYKNGIQRIENIAGNLTGTFTITDTNVHNLNNMTQSSPAFYDFTNDGYLEMIVGNIKGGVEYFHGIDESQVSISENKIPQSIVYPNPTTHTFAIKSDIQWEYLEIYSLTGQILINKVFSEKTDISHLPEGTYFIKLINSNNTETLKMIKK